MPVVLVPKHVNGDVRRNNSVLLRWKSGCDRPNSLLSEYQKFG